MTATDLNSIADRLEGATEADREIDEAIARHFNWCPLEVAADLWSADDDKPDHWFSDAFGMPAYTGSADAALALADKMLPGAWDAVLDEAISEMTDADSFPPLAQLPRFICLALVRSLLTKETE